MKESVYKLCLIFESASSSVPLQTQLFSFIVVPAGILTRVLGFLFDLRAVGAAAATKNPDTLTDEEMVGLALQQRCKLDIGSYAGHYALRPTNRVEFNTVDGRLRVVEKPR